MTRAILVALGLLIAPAVARAHPIEFGVVRVIDRGEGEVAIDLRFSGSEAAPRGVVPRLRGCDAIGAALERTESTTTIRRETFRCPRADLAGVALELEGLAGRDEQIVVRVERASGTTQRVVDGRDPRVLVADARAASVVARYAALGVEHILLGIDHLAFLVAMCFLVRGRRALIRTITAFTLGHSVTLAAASLGVLRVSPGPTEALIAISIVIASREALASRGGDLRASCGHGLTARRPELVAASFGLLHGLGFAGALREVGLPDDAIVPALLSFNVGVEVGQIVFVLALLSASRLFPPRTERWAQLVPRTLGAAGVFWAIERALAIVT